jgi:hypothetical protein
MAQTQVMAGAVSRSEATALVGRMAWWLVVAFSLLLLSALPLHAAEVISFS